MPLHKIPLCNFKYVGDISSAATFKYDVSENIDKNESKQTIKKGTIEIDKIDEKLAYKIIDNIEKNKYKLVYREKRNIQRYNYKLLYMNNFEIILEDTKLVYLNTSMMNRSKNYCLEKNNINFIKNKCKYFIKNNIKIGKVNTYNIKNKTDLELLFQNNNKNMKYTNVNAMNKSIVIQFNKNNIDAYKIGKKILKNIECRNILIKEKLFVLNRTNLTGIDKCILNNLFRVNAAIGIRINNMFLNKSSNKTIDFEFKNKNCFRNILKEFDIKFNNFLACKDSFKNLLLENYLFLSSFRVNNMGKNNINKLMYKSFENIVKNQCCKNLNKESLINIYNVNLNGLMYKITINDISKINNKFIRKKVILNLLKTNKMFLNRDKFKDIFMAHNINLNKNENINLNKYDVKYIKKDNFKNILRYQLHVLNKFENEIFNTIDFHGLSKDIKTINIIDLNIEYLEVIKRWWVLGAKKPYDKKILPYDYNYKFNPLKASRRDRVHGELINIDKHPISYMSYLEENKGIDLNYGIKEINLSIDVMLDMVNIVGMIVQHGSSQFVNCSGQEAIEFINEVLIEWLNLDTTVSDMDLNKSREHYLRTYRWIRWESEKVWFIADKDHTQDKMMGVKYANMLFANLVDYMKYHHFDLVPLWKNLKYMDIERQFNRGTINKDIMKNLDKTKGKRHYYIETQNLNKNNIVGCK